MNWRSIGILSAPLSVSRSISPIFNASPASKVFKLLGIADQFQIKATNLVATATYMQNFNNAMSRGLQDKTPIEFSASPGIWARLGIPSQRVYNPAIALVETQVEFSIDSTERVSELVGLRRLNSNDISPVGRSNRAAFSCIEKYIDVGETQIPYRGRPLFLIELGIDQAPPSEFARFNRAELVGLLIGNADYGSMHTDIVDSIFTKCAELNKKTSEEYLLASKQGLVVIGRSRRIGSTASGSGIFARSCACFELASVCLTILSYYPELREVAPEATDQSLVTVSYLVRNSRAIFNASYSSRELWNRLVEDMSIDALLELVLASNSDARDAINQRRSPD